MDNIKIIKTTRLDKIFIWVEVNNSPTSPSECFLDTEIGKATEYYNKLVAHYAKYGTFSEHTEVLKSEDLNYNPPL